MNNSNERRISSRYARLLSDRRTDDEGFFGFECSDGWSDLIEGTLSFVQLYSEVTNAEVRISQVKEKFGQLRIYQYGGDESVRTALEITELVSGKVCEYCGRAGEITNIEGWLQVRCTEHVGRPQANKIEPGGTDETYIDAYADTLATIISYLRTDALQWVQQESGALADMRPYEVLGNTEGCLAVYAIIKRLEKGVGT